jgi:hypothetical protein
VRWVIASALGRNWLCRDHLAEGIEALAEADWQVRVVPMPHIRR